MTPIRPARRLRRSSIALGLAACVLLTPLVPALAAGPAPTPEEERTVAPFDPRGEHTREATTRKAERGVPMAQYSLAQDLELGLSGPADPAAARRWYARAAEQGLGWSQRALGLMLRNGEGGNVDLPGAIVWLRKAAENNESYAMTELGNLLRRQGRPEDLPEAYRWLRRAAERGDERAKLPVALMLEAGTGTPKDPAEARRWLALASLEDDAARLHLQAPADLDERFARGLAPLAGIGVAPDRTAALALLRQAADRGHPGAMYHLFYATTADASASYRDARKWLEKAAQAGYPAAMRDLGRTEEHGSPAMVRWLRKAAEAGDVGAWYSYGHYPFEATGGPTKAEGVTWLRKAAERDHVLAQDALGDALASGWAGKVDVPAALGWYHRAAKLGSTSAMVAIAGLQDDGKIAGGPKEAIRWLRRAAELGAMNVDGQLARMLTDEDPAEALRWHLRDAAFSPENYEWNLHREIRQLLAAHPDASFDYAGFAAWLAKAAGWGYRQAQHDLALLYREGKGVPRDLAQAQRWLREAARNGLAEAQDALAAMAERGEGQPADDAEAVRLLKKSAKAGSPRAAWALSRRFWTGQGVDVDPAEARRLLEAAAKHGAVPEAAFDLGVRLVAGDGMPKDARRGIGLVGDAAEHLPEARRLLLDWVQSAKGFEPARIPFGALVAAAEGGEPKAAFDLAERYLTAHPRAIDQGEAERWLRVAADRGFATAQFRLSTFLAHSRWVKGEEIPANPDEAAAWLRRAADGGHAEALRALAEKAIGAQREGGDLTQALRWLERAAAQGDREARRQLGDIYAAGRYAVPAFDRDAAKRWYLAAAEAGDASALLAIAGLYRAPARGPRDPVEGARWAQKALDAGVRLAMWDLADAYLQGDGVPKDAARAVALLERLGTLDDEFGRGNDAWERLGELHERGEAGLTRDLRKAVAYYARAGEFTNAGPAYRLAELYAKGPREIRNPAEALRWHLTAIDYDTEGGDGTESFGGAYARTYGNLANARLAVAIRLERGDGFPRDLEGALRWYRSAAALERKYPAPALLGMFKVARLLEAGVGKDDPRAVDARGDRRQPAYWYGEAVQTWKDRYDRHLAIVTGPRWGMSPIEDAERRLPALLGEVRQAAGAGVAQAQYDFAHFLLEGRVTPRNDAEAVSWLTRAADAGHLGAHLALAEVWTKGEVVAKRPAEASRRNRSAADAALAKLAPGTRFEGLMPSPAVPAAYSATMKHLAALVRKPSGEQPNINVYVLRIDREAEPTTLAELRREAKRRGRPDAWADAEWRARPFIAAAKKARDPRAAFRATLQAAETGYAPAQSDVGERYERGAGVAKDEVAAYAWYALAAAQGDDDGARGMASLAASLSRPKIAQAQARAMIWWRNHHR